MRKARSKNSLVCSGEHNEDRKKFLIKQALLKARKPLTRRELSLLCPMEICSLCSPLLNMVKTGTLYIAYQRACVSTGKPVFHYALNSWKGAVNG